MHHTVQHFTPSPRTCAPSTFKPQEWHFYFILPFEAHLAYSLPAWSLTNTLPPSDKVRLAQGDVSQRRLTQKVICVGHVGDVGKREILAGHELPLSVCEVLLEHLRNLLNASRFPRSDQRLIRRLVVLLLLS